MDSESLVGIPDDSYFYKLPMNTELNRPSKRKSSCNIHLHSSKALVVLDEIVGAQNDAMNHHDTFEIDSSKMHRDIDDYNL
jgi:hypothetical protein